MVANVRRQLLPKRLAAPCTPSLAGLQELGRRGRRRRAVYSAGDLKDFAAPKTAADVRDLLAESMIEIRHGKLDPRVANALGYLSASYLRALEVSDLEARFSALERTQRTQERAFLQSSPESKKKDEG
jgi:hypothetical protein